MGILAEHFRGRVKHFEIWNEPNAKSFWQPDGAGGRADYPWTLVRQAKWMPRRFLVDLRMQTELISYFHLVDLVGYRHSDAPTGRTNYKGLLRRTDYLPKPAHFAFRCLCALFDRQTVRNELPMSFEPVANNTTINIEQIVSAGFTRHGKALYVYWLPPGPEMERPDEQISLSLAPSGHRALPE